MFEMFAEFDLIDGGYATGYFYGDTTDECMKQVADELRTWGGGHADVFDDDGEFFDWVEV